MLLVALVRPRLKQRKRWKEQHEEEQTKISGYIPSSPQAKEEVERAAGRGVDKNKWH